MKKALFSIFLLAVSITGCGQKDDASTTSLPTTPPASASEALAQPGFLSIGTKEVAKCAAIENQVLRVACYDDLASKYGLTATTKNTTTASQGRWETRTDTDPLTDKSIYRARLVAHEGRGRFADPIVLHLRCSNAKIEAYIDWSTFLGSDNISVTSRIDKSPAEKSMWSPSTDHKASFMPQPARTLKKFIGASSYVVNLTPYGESPITAIFDISGAEEALKDIRKACSTSLSSSSSSTSTSSSSTNATASESLKVPLGGSCKYMGDCAGTAICQNNRCSESP